MIGPGDLNRRLALEAPVEFDDGGGGFTRLYDVVTVVWAKVVPLSAAQSIVADSPGNAMRYRIVVREGTASIRVLVAVAKCCVGSLSYRTTQVPLLTRLLPQRVRQIPRP